MKTREELNALKTEVENLGRKLAELSEEELEQVAGGDVSRANIVGYNTNSKNGFAIATPYIGEFVDSKSSLKTHNGVDIE